MTYKNETATEPLDIARSLSDYPMKVYYDDGELYVSSDEVRIRDKSWKLEDIEYVNLECFEGWIWKVVIVIIVMAIMLFIRIELYSIIGALSLLPLWALYYLTLKTNCYHMWDDFTGKYWLRVFIHDSKSEVIRLGKEDKFKLGRRKRYQQKYQPFLDAICEAVYRMYECQSQNDDRMEEDYVPQNAVTNREFSVTQNTVRLFGMAGHIEEVSAIEYNHQSASPTLFFMPAIVCVILYLLYKIASVLGYSPYDEFTMIYSPEILITGIPWFLPVGIPPRYILKIHLIDGTSKTIMKWQDDPAKDALSKFAIAVRKQMKQNRKERRMAEQQ